MSKLESAVEYFKKQRQRFTEKDAEKYAEQIEHCTLALKALNKELKKEKDKQYTEAFNKFWVAYPRKVGKPSAFTAFKNLSPDEELLKVMLSSLEIQKCSNQWMKNNGEYIPHPSRYINDRRWEEFAQEAKEREKDVMTISMMNVPTFK